MKKKTKKSYVKRIIAGFLVVIMLLLEAVAVLAAEMDETIPVLTTENIETKETFESVMSEQFSFTLNENFITFPMTVPELIETTKQTYPHIASEIEGGYTATYRSKDSLYTVTFENPTDKTIDMNTAIVRSILITPQVGTTLKMSGLTIKSGTSVAVTDLTKVFGPYNDNVTVIYDDSSGVLIWDFDTYLIQITLEVGMVCDILVTNKADSLPKVSKDSFYDFASGEYYKIEVFESRVNYGTSLATTFYVTKEEKKNMESRLFFDLYINNTYPVGYLKQNESIDKLNVDNDYEAVLAELSAKMELDYYSSNATFITKTDYEIERENNIRYIITGTILTFAIVGLILFEKKKTKEKMKHELQRRKEERDKLFDTTGNEE